VVGSWEKTYKMREWGEKKVKKELVQSLCYLEKCQSVSGVPGVLRNVEETMVPEQP